MKNAVFFMRANIFASNRLRGRRHQRQRRHDHVGLRDQRRAARPTVRRSSRSPGLRASWCAWRSPSCRAHARAWPLRGRCRRVRRPAGSCRQRLRLRAGEVAVPALAASPGAPPTPAASATARTSARCVCSAMTGPGDRAHVGDGDAGLARAPACRGRPRHPRNTPRPSAASSRPRARARRRPRRRRRRWHRRRPPAATISSAPLTTTNSTPGASALAAASQRRTHA